MRQVTEQIRRLWAQSKTYRVILVVAVVYVVFRLVVHGAYLTILLSPNQNVFGSLPNWTGIQNPTIPDDLRIYRDAAQRLLQQETLYLQGPVDRMEFYQYAPSFALVFIPSLWFSPVVLSIIHTLLHLAAYAILYLWWGRIFYQAQLEQANKMLAWILPVWLFFSSFWTDMGYLNIYIFMALLSTLLIDAILNEQLWCSLVWLSAILQTKPQWAFAIAVPLFLHRYRFFFKLLALTVIAYLAVAGITILLAGPTYGWQQYIQYFQLLRRVQGGNYPWRTPDAPFLGYNHSIKQIIIYFLGSTPIFTRLATVVKVLLLMPLVIVGLRYLINPVECAIREVPQVALDFAFALYLGAFIWLDMVWEVSLSIAVFPYLLGTLGGQWTKVLTQAVFLPYALLDPLRMGSLVLPLFGVEVIAPGPYILTDLNIYIPLMMIVILTFYALLIKRLWITLLASQEIGKNSYGI